MPDRYSKLEKPEKDVEVLISESAVRNVRRITDADQLQRFFRRVIAHRMGDSLRDLQYTTKYQIEDIAEDYANDIGEIRELIRDKIVWGIVGQTGELLSLAHLMGGVEQLGPEDAKNYKTLYMMGLIEAPELFGEKVEVVRDLPVSNFKRRLEERFVAGISFRYKDEKGKIRKHLVGTGSVAGKGGNRAHIADFKTLYIDKAHRSKRLARPLFEERIKYAIEHGFEKVHIVVTATNEAVIKANIDLGFIDIGKPEHNAARIERENPVTGKKEVVYFDWVHLELDLEQLKAERAARAPEITGRRNRNLRRR